MLQRWSVLWLVRCILVICSSVVFVFMLVGILIGVKVMDLWM